jgi:hypothetical protein
MSWDVIKLAFEFLPKLPVVQRGMAAIKEDDEAVYVIDHIVPVTKRALENPDVLAMLQVFRDLFSSLAAEGEPHDAVSQVLMKYGAPKNEVFDFFGPPQMGDKNASST